MVNVFTFSRYIPSPFTRVVITQTKHEKIYSATPRVFPHAPKRPIHFLRGSVNLIEFFPWPLPLWAPSFGWFRNLRHKGDRSFFFLFWTAQSQTCRDPFTKISHVSFFQPMSFGSYFIPPAKPLVFGLKTNFGGLLLSVFPPKPYPPHSCVMPFVLYCNGLSNQHSYPVRCWSPG